ncbi:MAG: glycosyltransferase family 39 protein [Bauldia sp.]
MALTGTAEAERPSPLQALADRCLQHPGRTLAAVLAAHFAIWVAVPIVTFRSLQIDFLEGLALGREWLLGSWKHPTLPWWLDEIAYRLFGDVRGLYLLGPLAAIACMVAVWRLARELVPATTALIAVLALEGMHFFNFTAVKFAHDTLLLPFAALSGWFFYRATARQRTVDWLLLGLFLALSFWSKYSAALLGATLGLVMLLDPVARRSWRTPGPYLAAVVFLLVLAPNLWWLVTHQFQPFVYAEESARAATRWSEYLTFPLRWAVSQIAFVAPAFLLLLVVSYRGSLAVAPAASSEEAYARRLLAALALGPFLITVAAAAALGKMPLPRWGYPLWSFMPLAVLLWWPPISTPRRRAVFAAAFGLVFAAFPIAYLVGEIFEPLVRDRPKATDFPGEEIAMRVTEIWHRRTGQPLAYVGGTEFPTNVVAHYSPDRPRVLAHGDLSISPWIDPADLRRRGVVLIVEGEDSGFVESWRRTFPNVEPGGTISVARRTLVTTNPASVTFAFVAPTE